MKKKEKELLLKDLCARLPYGVKIMFSFNGFRWDWEQTLSEICECEDGEYAINGWGIHGIKPYLRSISSMTEEEKTEWGGVYAESSAMPFGEFLSNTSNWLKEHHFDYRGLIKKGLAIEAPEGMYK